jgi:hypothetical protein
LELGLFVSPARAEWRNNHASVLCTTIKMEDKMDDLFYKRLNNWWDYLFDQTKYRFFIRVPRGNAMIHSHVTIFLPLGDSVEVRFVADDHSVCFTEPVMNNIFNDITRLVHHYFPERKRIECRVMRGESVVYYDWDINRLIRKRGLRCR